MRTFILSARFIQGILGANWKQKITSSIAIVILAVMAIRLSFPTVWQVWAWTAYFWFTIIALLIAVLAFQTGKSFRGYIILIIALTPSLIFIPKALNKLNGNLEENSDGQQTEVQVPDTTYHNVNGTLAMILVHGETYETTLPRNCEVVVRGTNFKQIITTDSLGIKNLNTVEGDASQVGAGQFVFIHTKGNGTPIVKTWRVF